MNVDLARLNSLTKYPSIQTWHILDGKGLLTAETPQVDQTTIFLPTEKVDGTNGRLVKLGASWWIGSRDNLLAASDGSIPEPKNPLERSIVDVLRPIAERALGANHVVVWFFEVFGAGIGASCKEYSTRSGSVSCRLFDRAVIKESAEILSSWTPERISGWRKRGGQKFDSVEDLACQLSGVVQLVPFLSHAGVQAFDLPRRLEDGRPFIERWVGAKTRCALDDEALGRPEGLVVRTSDRSLIFKLRLEDYDRAMRKWHHGYDPERHADFMIGES